MKKILLFIVALMTSAVMMAQLDGKKIYVNPGHGSWTSECRNMLLVNIPHYGDTLAFWE